MKLATDWLVVMRGERTVIDGLSFEVPAGEALIVTGANGAGKTTLLRALAGFLPADEGEIRLEGGEPDQSMAEQCHFIGHGNGMKPGLTVAENLSFWARYLDGAGDPRGRVTSALEAFALLDLAHIPFGYLSAGQKRRAGLARLLVADRRIWLLDEPTASLDAASAARLVKVASDHIAGGGLAVVATHAPLALASARELRLGHDVP